MRRLVCLLLLVVLAVPAFAARGSRRKAAPAPGAEVDGTVPSYADRVPIHYHAVGQGLPALVFIHCWSCDSSFWRNEVPMFSKDHRVVTLDLAGHGSSGTERRAWTMPAYAADVKTVVEHLNLSKVILVGHSMGGDVMVEAARIMPDRVVGLVAVDTLQDADQKIDPALKAQYLAAMRQDFKGTTQGYVRERLFPGNADPALVAQVADKMSSAPPEVAIPSTAAAMDYDLAAGLKRVRAPIIAINSDRFPTNLDGNRKYAPRFDVVLMKGVGHFPQLERPDEFNALLADAIAKLTPPAKKRSTR